MIFPPVNSPFDLMIGSTLELATAEKVITHTPVRLELSTPRGIIHGGLLATLAETSASIGASKASPTGEAVGQSNHTEFLRPASRESKELITTATPIRVGRQVQVWDVSIADNRGVEIAHSTVRLFNVNPPRSNPAS